VQVKVQFSIILVFLKKGALFINCHLLVETFETESKQIKRPSCDNYIRNMMVGSFDPISSKQDGEGFGKTSY
jgi:hypothetical protein